MAFSFILSNRQRAVAFDIPLIRAVVGSAWPSCVASSRPGAPLPGLALIEASILSDRRIGAVHREFFEDPSPTDVITFHHGEILLGAGVIAENAVRYGRSTDEEAALCLIHGALHLAGWDDSTFEDAKKMARRQEQIFKLARGMVGCPLEK